MTLPKLHYALVVAGVTFLVLLVGAGMRAVPGVFVVPLENEFGWSRATISLAVGVCIGLYGLMAPFSAATMDRFGVRGTMVGGAVLDRHRRRAAAADDAILAAHSAVGCVGRLRHRLRRQRAGRDRRDALVRGAARHW